MRIVIVLVLTMLSVVADAALLEKWGPTWSEVTGNRYYRAAMNRAPAIIKSIDGRDYHARLVKIDPGMRKIVVQSPYRKGFQGSDQAMDLDLKPCRRYYINAQFDSSVGPEWKPVLVYTEKIAGCKIPPARAATPAA